MNTPIVKVAFKYLTTENNLHRNDFDIESNDSSSDHKKAHSQLRQLGPKILFTQADEIITPLKSPADFRNKSEICKKRRKNKD